MIARIGHQERALGDDPRLVPAGRLAELHHRQVAVVVGLRRPHRGVHMPSVAAGVVAHLRTVDIGHADVPIRAVVAPALPGMGDRGRTVGAAVLCPPAVPSDDLRPQRRDAVAPGLGIGLPDQPRQRRRNRRLADAGGLGGGLACPRHRAGEIARIVGVENDVRHHPVVPLAGEQRLQLGPGAVDIEGRKPPGGKGAVPVPLERIEPGRRNGIAAPVVAAQDRAGLIVQCRRLRPSHVVIPSHVARPSRYELSSLPCVCA